MNKDELKNFWLMLRTGQLFLYDLILMVMHLAHFKLFVLRSCH